MFIESIIVIDSTALGSPPQLNSYALVYLIYQQDKKMLFFSHQSANNA
jgi:hypothetical protein